MVATSRVEDATLTKDFIKEAMTTLHPIYIKEKQLSKDIFLLIVIMKNKLEFNISIVPTSLLSVKSPLWKVIVDKTGSVTKKMHLENEHFINKPVKYNINMDLVFEFVYCALALEKELKRKNIIYALKLLENSKNYTLIVQALNEDKKLHQFKAYETLSTSFIQAYLSTYPEAITVQKIQISAEKLKELFIHTLKQSSIFSIDHDLKQLLHTSYIRE